MDKREIKIALAGNPNCGKTTVFNALTGSNQFVGNWPGVTVEKKEGRLKGHDEIIITDLPGIYSLSPYTPEEVVARRYLVDERPDAILNIIDGTNIERNLYLTTQLVEIGLPVVMAINMMDVVEKNDDRIDTDILSKEFGCPVMPISAVREQGLLEAALAASEAAKSGLVLPIHRFSGVVEHALAHIEEATIHNSVPLDRQRWYAVKLFERDERVRRLLNLPNEVVIHIEDDIKLAEAELGDDSESIIINQRYNYIEEVIKRCYKRKHNGLSTSERIDKVVTNRFLALPIFAVMMFLVYYISVTTVGGWATDWANDGVFGEGWHLFGIGSAEYYENASEFASENIWTEELMSVLGAARASDEVGARDIEDAVLAKDYQAFIEGYDSYKDSLFAAGYDIAGLVEPWLELAPAPSEYGIWVSGVPVLAAELLENAGCADWLKSLIVDGIIAGVGSVLGFVPQMLVLFLFLAFLEACGYMSRIAFVMDKLFRKFGLSGKSFIPMLIGTGCGVPGIMASRTIENDSDRRMTIMTTTFIPCGAKLPVIAMVSTAIFGGAWWVAPSAYFAGVAAIVISGIILKKTKPFISEPSPFVMELPAYHMPTLKNLMNSMWERGSSFIKKAGTIILLASIFVWTLSHVGFVNGSLRLDIDMALETSILGTIGSAISVIFVPLGFGSAKASVATLMGIIAKEEIVGVFGVLDFEGMTKLSAYSFLIFNLLCAPCVAAIGAIRREMNSPKWTLAAICYQCGFAYCVSLIIYQLGNMAIGRGSLPGIIAGFAVSALIIFLIARKPSTIKK